MTEWDRHERTKEIANDLMAFLKEKQYWVSVDDLDFWPLIRALNLASVYITRFTAGNDQEFNGCMGAVLDDLQDSAEYIRDEVGIPEIPFSVDDIGPTEGTA